MSRKIKKPGHSDKIYHIENIGPLPENRRYDCVKRIIDLIGAMFFLFVLAIPMMIISILIVKDSPGGVIYTQKRLGIHGKPFTIYKFRSMRSDAEANGIQWADKNDIRVTRLGRFLRAYRLDELPQLWNILRGDMSFVGPRPERPEYYHLFDSYIIGFRQRMQVMPGLTGYAQVNGGYDLLPEEKILYDIEYIKNRSVGFDMKCMLQTIRMVILHKDYH